MKHIGLHTNSLDGRGGGCVTFAYGIALINLGYKVTVCTSFNEKSDNISLNKFKNNNISVKGYNLINGVDKPKLIVDELSKIIDNEKIEFMNFMKSGENDYVTPINCKTGISCVFNTLHPHGDVYSPIAEYLNVKYNTNYPWVNPPVPKYMIPTENIRQKYNIPNNSLVLGRHGGYKTFDLPFVKESVKDILKLRNDIYFLFLSTEKFIDNPRVIFIPWVESDQDKFNFVNACDAMLHGRSDGEIFSISIAEFSVSNKPIITWSGKISPTEYYVGYNTGHFYLLDDSYVYDSYVDLMDILKNISHQDINKISNYDYFSKEYNIEKTMNKFINVFGI